jgi:hypothetical protein
LILWLFVFGSDGALSAFGARLEKVGFTTLKTPLGDISPAKLSQLKSGSETAAVGVAVLGELAQRESDPSKKKVLQDIATSLATLQDVQLTVANELSNRSSTQVAPTAAQTAESIQERWLFIGRHSEGAWRPLSFSVGQVDYPLKVGSRVTIKSEALLYPDSSCEAKKVPSPSYEATRATTVGLEITAEQVLCPSVGGASTVWAKVRVPADLFVKR